MLGNNGLSIFGDTISKDALLAMAGIGQGRNYYVNNITGDSGNSGLSWDSAMDEVTTAITASETYRALPAATNEFIRNTIFVQGTGTAYAEITTPPNYTNVIGLGATAHGYGEGVARIGLDIHTAGTLGGGMGGSTSDCKGSYFYNIEFQASNNKSAVSLRDVYKTTFEDCAFMASGNPISPPDCGFEITRKASGLRLLNCLWGTHSGLNSEPWYGLKINGTLFNNCEVTNCHIVGITAGIYVVSTMTLGWNSIVRNCYIGEGSSGCVIGIDDNATIGTIHYYNCFINAADPIDPTEDATRFVGCMAEAAFVAT